MPNHLIKNAAAFTLQPPAFQNTNIRIRADTVSEVAPNLHAFAGEEVFDATGKLMLPGLVNAHTHLYSTLARGMPGPASPPQNFHEILQKIWWRLDRALERESIYYSALIGAIEAIKCGTTTLIDHHASPNWISGSLSVIRQALAEVGMRSVLCYETTDRGGEAERDLGLEENDDFLSHRQTDNLCKGLVGAHASFTLSDHSLRACAELAQRHGCGVHVHLAEDGCDAALSQEEFGRGDLAHRLDDFGLLSEKTILAHGIFLSDEEVRLIRQKRCWLMHNARSNMNNSVGYAPVHKFGNRVSLGTDGFPADMFEEARLAFFKGRDAKNGLGLSDYVGFLSAGHQICSEIFNQPFGAVAVGAAADFIFLDYPAPTPLVPENLAGHLLFGMKAEHVTEVMIAGRFVMRKRELAGLPLESIYQEAREAAQRLWRRMEAIA